MVCCAAQVGIEECLHIEFEYDKARYHLKVRRRAACNTSCLELFTLFDRARHSYQTPNHAHLHFLTQRACTDCCCCMCLLCPWPDCGRPPPCILVIKCQDVVNGKIYFLLVRIKLKHMEVEIRRRETTGMCVCAHSRLALTARTCTLPQHTHAAAAAAVCCATLSHHGLRHTSAAQHGSVCRPARSTLADVLCVLCPPHLPEPGAGSSAHNESETIAKYEIMDGAPVRGENIPIR